MQYSVLRDINKIYNSHLPKTRQNTYILGMPSDRCANDNGCWLGGKTNIALVTLGRKNCVVEVRKVVTVYCDNWSFIASLHKSLILTSDLNAYVFCLRMLL